MTPSPEVQAVLDREDKALLNAIDQQYFFGVLTELQREVSRAGIYLRSAFGRLQVIAGMDGLTEPLRRACEETTAALAPLLRGLDSAKHFMRQFDLPYWHHALSDEFSPPAGWLAQAEQVIAQINAAELEMVQQLEATRATLLGKHGNGIFDWSMPFDLVVRITLHVPASRQAYACWSEDYEEPIEIRLGPYNPIPTGDEVENWNPFQWRPEHPLASCHMEYLLHCLLDHDHLPWQLLPLLKDVEVHLEYTDNERIWPVEDRYERHHAVLENGKIGQQKPAGE